MANFPTASRLTAANEGGWANHPNDTGGETMLGVSRRNFPNWAGWATVDALKKKPGFPDTANAHTGLKQAAEALYKTAFWNALQLDHFASQALANDVYDFGVNAGTLRAAQTVQRAYNLSTTGPQLEVDGKIGPATVSALNSHRSPALLRKAFALLRGSFYLSIAERTPSQRVFVPSWLSRISLT